MKLTVKVKYIYWFAHYNMLAPCARYRGKYLLDGLLKKYDIPHSFVYPSYELRQLLNFIKVYLSALLFRKKNSVIVFQKTYTKRLYSKLLSLLLAVRRENTYYDIDDAYYVIFPPNTINHFLKNCQTCITGSKTLAEYAKRYSKNKKNVFILSSPVLLHNNIKNKCSDLFTIGWAGFYNCHRDSLLQLLFPAIKNLDFPLKLTLLGVVKKSHFHEISCYFKENINIQLDIPLNVDWLNEDLFYKTVMSFDVGVSPLLENELNIAKSAFKIKQYLSCGVPVIGSSTGENNNVIKDNINGYVANSASEFRDCLIKFYNLREEECQIMRRNALQSVKRFAIDKYCEDFMSILEKAKQ